MTDPDLTIERREGAGKASMSLLEHIYVERGELADWRLLEELHYKSANLGIGPRFWRAVLDEGTGAPQTIGVIVLTVPKPLDAGRNQVFPHLCPNKGGRDNRLINRMRMKWLNENLILSSRTVVDTMYRGAGIAYRFRNITLRMAGKRYVEARSSMSRYNPFALKAGMRYVQPKSAAALESGLQFFRRHFKSPAYDQVAIMEELAAMPGYLRERVLKELRDFYYRHSSMEKSGDNRLNGMDRINGMELGYLLKQVFQLIFGATVYAVWENPDWKRELPARIPLSAFDLQGPNQPLRLDLLK